MDQFSWTTFTLPFDQELWLSLLGFSIGTSVFIWLFHKYPKGSTSLDFLESIFISTYSIFSFGIKDANDVKSTRSAKLSMFVIFSGGSVFYSVYGSYLTSALAIPKIYKPFSSPEGILNTNYRYLIAWTT